MDVPVGEALLGRVVSAIGAPIDGKGEIAYAENALLNLLLMVLRIVNLLILRCKLVSNVSMLSSLSDVVSANLLSVTVAQAKLLLLLILLLTKRPRCYLHLCSYRTKGFQRSTYCSYFGTTWGYGLYYHRCSYCC